MDEKVLLNKFKRPLFNIHHWLRLNVGVFLLLLGLSASLLVFQDEPDEFLT